MTHAGESFDEFMTRRQAASDAYINGRPEGVAALSARQEPVTFFPPSGARITGVRQVDEANAQGAKAFGEGASARFEVLQSGSSGDLAFWTGVHHASVILNGKPVTMELRTTEVFRREDGDWRLVHRHADMPPPPG